MLLFEKQRNPRKKNANRTINNLNHSTLTVELFLLFFFSVSSGSNPLYTIFFLLYKARSHIKNHKYYHAYTKYKVHFILHALHAQAKKNVTTILTKYIQTIFSAFFLSFLIKFFTYKPTITYFSSPRFLFYSIWVLILALTFQSSSSSSFLHNIVTIIINIISTTNNIKNIYIMK